MIDLLWPARNGTARSHVVLGAALVPPFPANCEVAVFCLGCFWGAERRFWMLPGIHVTAVGYSGGHDRNPDYHSVCRGTTGHAEAVLVIHDPARISYQELLRVFWESHDPTQGMRQGNDIGDQYRSAIYAVDSHQLHTARQSSESYQQALHRAGYGLITTEIIAAGPFYYAEPYHQQYLAKNPTGYCGLGGTGVRCSAANAT